MDYNEFCLIITGCISPSKDMIYLNLRDDKKRIEQYYNSIEYYLTKTKIKNIVYCDNSEAEPYEKFFRLAKEYSKNFEWLSFKSDSQVANKKGKGYGEGEIMEYAINNSAIVSRCDYIVKITGRLILINIDNLINKAYITKNYFNASYRHRFADTRFYMCQKYTYVTYLKEAYKYVDELNGICLESVFYTIFSKKIKYYSLPQPLNIIGMSGSTGKAYNTSKFKLRYKALFAYLINIALSIKYFLTGLKL